MLCPHCHAENLPEASHCRYCRSELAPSPLAQSLRHQRELQRQRSVLMSRSVPAYLGPAVLLVFFAPFLPPVWLWAFWHVWGVRRAIAANETQAALEHSRMAGRLIWIGFAVGGLCYLLLFVLYMIVKLSLE